MEYCAMIDSPLEHCKLPGGLIVFYLKYCMLKDGDLCIWGCICCHLPKANTSVSFAGI